MEEYFRNTPKRRLRRAEVKEVVSTRDIANADISYHAKAACLWVQYGLAIEIEGGCRHNERAQAAMPRLTPFVYRYLDVWLRRCTHRHEGIKDRKTDLSRMLTKSFGVQQPAIFR